MSKLNITKGEWEYKMVSTHNGSFYRIKGPTESVCNIITRNYDTAEQNAILITDAGNTYQKCEKLPSQLLEENERMKEALEYFVKRCEEGSIRSITTYRKYKELLKSLEQ